MPKSKQRGSVMVLFTLMLPSLLIPLVGLAIDASICRLAQARLQAAVDGAALGAGRLLGAVADSNIEDLAREFIDANFRVDNSAGTWGVYNLQKTDVHYTPGVTKRIDINASADVPLLFMRILGKTTATITAGGSATRSDSRVMFVIDRSPSMNAVLATVKTQAQGFVNGFTSSADELGLVVLDSSAFVAYPPYNPAWDPTITATSTGGPSAAFNLSTDPNNMVNQIGAIQTSNAGYTGTSDALSMAYIELQKTHLRDVAADPGGKDNRLNSIVLLTDGLPQSVSVYPNDWNTYAGTSNYDLTAGTGCTNKVTALVPKPPPIVGWVGVPRPFTSNPPSGLYHLSSTDTTSGHTTSWYLTTTGADNQVNSSVVGTNGGGCQSTFSTTPASFTGSNTDFNGGIPHFDRYGNSMDGTAYMTASQFVDVNGNPATNQLPATTTYDRTQYQSGTHWSLAFWNAADDSAKRIRADWNKPNRTGDTLTMPIYIYVIGYTGNGGVDQGLLRRMANDPLANNFDPTQPVGHYYSAGNAAQLTTAFNTVLTAILRLAK